MQIESQIQSILNYSILCIVLLVCVRMCVSIGYKIQNVLLHFSLILNAHTFNVHNIRDISWLAIFVSSKQPNDKGRTRVTLWSYLGHFFLVVVLFVAVAICTHLSTPHREILVHSAYIRRMLMRIPLSSPPLSNASSNYSICVECI